MLARLQPPPVQVEPQQRSPVVAVHHSVRVQHRHDLEHVAGPQLHGDRVVAEEELDEALDDPGGLSFARVNARGYHHSFLMFVVFIYRFLDPFDLIQPFTFSF